MADDSLDLSAPPPSGYELSAQDTANAKRRALAALLQQQGMQGVQAPSRGAMHWTQTLGPAIAALAGGFGTSAADTQSQDIAKQRQTAQDAWMKAMPMGTPGVSAADSNVPQPGNVGPPEPGAGAPMLPKPPDPMKLAQWGVQGTTISPAAAKIGEAAAAQGTKNMLDPYEKVGSDLYNRQTGEFIRSPTSEDEARSKIQQRYDAIQVKYADQMAHAKTAQDQIDAANQRAKDHNELMRELAASRQANAGQGTFTMAGQDAQGNPVIMNSKSGQTFVNGPQGMVPHTGHVYKPGEEKNIAAAGTQASGIQDMQKALDAVKGDPALYGKQAGLASHLPNTLGMGAAASGLSQDQLATRAQISSATAQVTHSMYGTAFSANEAKQAKSFLVQPDDSSSLVQAKLEGRLALEKRHFDNLPQSQKDAVKVRMGGAAPTGAGGARNVTVDY